MIVYKIQITYPNSQIEEINEEFYTLAKAKECGDHLLGQVLNNANYHEDNHDIEGFTKKVKPFYVVIARENDKERVAFDSRKK